MELTKLKGVGEKTAEHFAKLDLYTTEDLLKHYPRSYDIYNEPVTIKTLEDLDEESAIEGVVCKSPDIFGSGKIKILSAKLKDMDGTIFEVVFFNMPYLKASLKLGARYVFRGKFKIKGNHYCLEQPKIFTLAKYNELKGAMMPIYPLTKGLSNNMMLKCISQVLDINKDYLEPEFIPSWVREKYELAEHNFAIQNIHFPKEFDDYIKARHRLAFEEFFLFILATLSLKSTKESNPNNFHIKRLKEVDEFLNNLPFKLTNAQLRTLDEVRSDLTGDRTMSRLIQGDVGSGKTIVATISLLEVALNGYQGAMMVPTEVLAIQHFESLKSLFETNNLDIKVELLVGSMTKKQKEKAYERIESGESQIIVGTHALIQEKLVYKDLALVITDEQHRFGVCQRENFAGKGNRPHILVMSATPIPRTLAIILYGDLDISIIDEMPKGRLPIKNAVVDESYRKNAESFLNREVSKGHQCYVICPMVEESENFEAANVIDYTKNLKAKLPNCKIEYLHGKLKPKEKEEIMRRFSNREIDILVSTTVIEVGVNVPNATVMLIENAEMFGLAGLHQLRGRVGRGDAQSYCIFMTGKKSEKIKKRLDILNKSNDGFEIARKDLELRGPGDFFGVRQSGDFDFGIADVFADSKTLKECADAAKTIYDSDNTLSSKDNIYLKKKVIEYTGKVLEKINL